MYFIKTLFTTPSPCSHTGKTIIKDGVNGFPSYFMNGAIYGSKTDYQEDDVRLNAVLPNGRKTASVKTPRDLPLERQSP